MVKEFSRTEFVTVNIAKDWINSLRDMLGLEQKSYARVVNDKCKEILDDVKKEGEIIWFRQFIDQDNGTSIRITIYGQIEV